MASYNSIVLTTVGTQMLKSAISNGTKITFTKAQTSQTQYSQSQLTNLSVLSPTAQETVDLKYSNANSKQTKISITFTNKEVTTAYNANTVALFASNGTDEFLFAVATAKIAESVPAFDGTQAQSMVIDFYLALNAENATVNVDNAGMVSGSQLADVQSKLSQSIDIVDKNAVHLGGTETISGDKNYTGTLQKNGVDVATKNDNVASADKLTTAREIGGVAFDGTADINLPGVNATGNQNTTGLANAVQSLEITSGTDLSTIKGYGGSAVYHIEGGITLTSTPSDYSGKGAILKVTEANTTVYQELIDVMTDNGSWIRIISASTVYDWKQGGGGVEFYKEADIPSPTFVSASYPYDASRYTVTFSNMHIAQTDTTLRLTGNLVATGNYGNAATELFGYSIDFGNLRKNQLTQTKKLLWLSTATTKEVKQTINTTEIDYISFDGSSFYIYFKETYRLGTANWTSDQIKIDITVTY